ncbi:MAG: methyltransferase domain-containing protein, partial [Verrucomicrobiae bacterium]|nr:methyltransferase domain-containing protein [Verrucomicrobiae bacterium]
CYTVGFVNAREVAFDLLLRWECCRRPADELLEEHRGIGELSACDRALATELFYGCLRHKLALEFLVSKLVRKRPRPALNSLLRLGFYQVFYLNMAPHAAVNETVELAKQRVSRREAQFVNAVLRRACNNRVIFITELLRTRTDAPWVFFSHPKWLWQRWAARLGTELTRQLCEWNNQPAPLYVRGDHPWPGVLEPTSLHPLCYRVKEPAKFFANCKSYYVQDPSTLIAVDVLDPQPVESVLDLCAAPGGKTTYIAQKMQNRGRVVAVDVSAQRLGLVRENCQRLGVSIVSAVVCDGRSADCCLRGAQFDRVLVDVPCSNTGGDAAKAGPALETERIGDCATVGAATGVVGGRVTADPQEWSPCLQHVQFGTRGKRTRRRALPGGAPGVCARDDAFDVSTARRVGRHFCRAVSTIVGGVTFCLCRRLWLWLPP